MHRHSQSILFAAWAVGLLLSAVTVTPNIAGPPDAENASTPESASHSETKHKVKDQAVFDQEASFQRAFQQSAGDPALTRLVKLNREIEQLHLQWDNLLDRSIELTGPENTEALEQTEKELTRIERAIREREKEKRQLQPTESHTRNVAFPESEETSRRIQQIRQAAKSLEQAGVKQIAQELAFEADQMQLYHQQKLRTLPQQGFTDTAPKAHGLPELRPDDESFAIHEVHDAVRMLHQELRDLRRDVRQLSQRLDKRSKDRSAAKPDAK